ncbi:MAG: hypothetical protein WC852_06210 [Candidatus Nanoarchaeia archaeon]|jgi:hypothetical protein
MANTALDAFILMYWPREGNAGTDLSYNYAIVSFDETEYNTIINRKRSYKMHKSLLEITVAGIDKPIEFVDENLLGIYEGIKDRLKESGLYGARKERTTIFARISNISEKDSAILKACRDLINNYMKKQPNKKLKEPGKNMLKEVINKLN